MGGGGGGGKTWPCSLIVLTTGRLVLEMFVQLVSQWKTCVNSLGEKGQSTELPNSGPKYKYSDFNSLLNAERYLTA